MALQYFALDSTHEDFATVISALATASAGNLGYTPTIVQRAADHNANIKIVAGAVDAGDLTGDLADLATINALCVDKFVDIQEMREFGFYTLGEPERSWNPKLVNGNMYIRAGLEGDTAGDGKTPFTATTMQALSHIIPYNYQNMPVGSVYYNQDGTTSNNPQTVTFEDGGTSDDEVVIRCDHTTAPGALTDSYYWTRSSGGDVGQAAWVQDGTEPEVWSQADFQSTHVGGPMLVMDGDFPLLGTSTEWHDDWILEGVGDLATCRATPSSFFMDHPTIHVHLHDGASPGVTGRKILRRELGHSLNGRKTAAPYAPKIRFINCQVFGCKWAENMIRGHEESYNADKVTFEGGRYIWTRSDWFMRGACTERSFIASTVGRINWDTSDRPDTPDSEGVLELLTPNETWATNMAAGDWDDWKHHVEIGYMTVGVHPSSSVGTSQIAEGFPTNFILDGFYFHHLEDTKGHARDNADRHPIAIRGNKSGGTTTVRRGYVYRAPNMLYWYAPSSAEGRAPAAGSANSITPYTIEDLVFDTWSDNLPTAGNFGIQVGGDSDAILMDNGTGDRQGTIRRIVMIDHRPTGSTLGAPAQEHRGFLFNCADPNTMMVDSTSLRCNWGFRPDQSGAHVQAFSSIQLVDNGTVDTDATETVIETVNTPLEMPLTGTFAVVVGTKQWPFRRIQIRLTQNGAGGATVEWQYWNGAWTAIPGTGFTDGTSGLTTSGTITFTKPGDWVANTIGTRECFHVRAVVTAGSFSTTPIMDQCRGNQTNFFLRGRRIRILEPEVGLFWSRANTFFNGQALVDMDDITIRPKAGFDIETDDIARFGSSSDFRTLAELQAMTKSAATTDAPEDSTFFTNVTLLEPLA